MTLCSYQHRPRIIALIKTRADRTYIRSIVITQSGLALALKVSGRLATAYVKGFGCRRVASGRPGKEPASESLRRRNPRESDERLAVYGDLARQELWQGMVIAGSLKAESR